MVSAEPKWTPGPWRVNKYGGIGAGDLGISPVVATVDGSDVQRQTRRLRRLHMIEAIGISAFAVIGAISIGLPVGWAAAHLIEELIRP